MTHRFFLCMIHLPNLFNTSNINWIPKIPLVYNVAYLRAQDVETFGLYVRWPPVQLI